MTAPWERPELTEAEKTAQREMRDRLVRAAMFPVDTLAIDHRNDLALRVPPASASRLLVEAAIGALIDVGLITETNPDGPWTIRPTLPEHLQPDVDAEVERYRQIRGSQP